MSWWGTLKKKAGLQIRKFSQSVSRATAAVQRTVSRGVTAIKKTASKTGTAIKRTVSKLTTTIKQNGVKVQKFITSAVKATKMAIKKGIKVAKTAVKKIVKAGKKIGKAAKAFAKKAVLQTQKFLNSMARATKAFTKKTKGTLEAAKQKATAFVKREGGKVVTQARKIKNNLSQNERVKRLKNDMRKALVLSKSFGKGVWDGGKEAFTDTVELAKQLWYNPEQTVQNIGQSLRGEYSKAKKFAGQMVSDPFGTTNKVILGIEKEYDEFQKLSPEQRAYVIGKFGGNKVVNLVGDKGLSVVTKQMAKAAMRLPPHAINVINNERGSISIGGSNRNKTTQGTSQAPQNNTAQIKNKTSAERAAEKGFPGIKTTKNGGPDFAGTPYLYPTKEGQKNIVKIKMTGDRQKDFKAANEKAGFPDAGRKSPHEDYTWHHLDDYDPSKGTCTMQLVEKEAHKATYPHKGSCSQYDDHHGEKIYNKPKKKGSTKSRKK